jgi:hypothetical protein
MTCDPSTLACYFPKHQFTFEQMKNGGQKCNEICYIRLFSSIGHMNDHIMTIVTNIVIKNINHLFPWLHWTYFLLVNIFILELIFDYFSL